MQRCNCADLMVPDTSGPTRRCPKFLCTLQHTQNMGFRLDCTLETMLNNGVRFQVLLLVDPLPLHCYFSLSHRPGHVPTDHPSRKE